MGFTSGPIRVSGGHVHYIHGRTSYNKEHSHKYVDKTSKQKYRY